MEKETFATMTIADAKAVYKAAKAAKAPVKGRISLRFTDVSSGLNVRSVYGNTKGMLRLFDKFTKKGKPNLSIPYIDTMHNVLVASDGVSMILCNVPAGLTKDDAVRGGFKWNVECDLPWWNVLPDREVTGYNLAGLKLITVIRKGDSLHNLLVGLAECAKAYEHEDREGCFHSIYCWFGEKLYNIRAVAHMVDGLFKLGNSEVRLCEQVGACGWSSYSNTPMHIVGTDGGNNSRGLVMPIRHYGMTDGAFEFPIINEAANAA